MSRRLVSLLLTALLLPSLALAAGAPTAPRGPAPVEGRDYELIEGGQPFMPAADGIEVAEVFGYTCPHCARFEPVLAAWKAKLPPDVKLVRIPAPFGGPWVPYARAYYAGESLGVTARSHPRVFRAVHETAELPRNATAEEIATFYAGLGVPQARFQAAYADAAVDAQLERARQFIQRSGIDGTPALVVAGRYRVRGTSFEDMLRITEHLIARERAAR
jgi:thiol:disulfide interchange protein DsbA